VVIGIPCAQETLVVGRGRVVWQYVSDVSESDAAPVTEESSDVWDETSDQTEAEEEDAEDAIEEL
jgi:hypothetical protein